MPSVVFLRAVNVGRTNRCSTALLAKQLAKFDVINIGAVGTFVVRKNAIESTLRSAIAKQLSFKCEIMIVPASAILRLADTNPFARYPSSPDITRFVNVLHKPLAAPPALPIALPDARNWLAKIIAIEGRFVLGVYRREIKAIRSLGKIEKMFGAPATNRNWNTIEKVVEVLKSEA
jgi:uncharacterized protein (DUF1697 family)